MSKLRKLQEFVLADHRYVLLGTSVVAFLGMLLSSSARSSLSFLSNAFTVELVMYYVLVAWLVLSAMALIFKLAHWNTYAETAPFTKPSLAKALRMGSYVIWAITAVLIVDRWVMGFIAAWIAAAAAPKMPEDTFQQVLYMFQQGRDTYISGIVTTIELAVFGTVIAFFLAMLLVFVRILEIDRSDNDAVRFFKVIGVWFAKIYSTVVRGTPMLVQGVILYYAGFQVVSNVFGLTVSESNVVWSRMTAGLVVISLNSTAYMMEVLRGGIESVDPGQMEAARSLGLSQWQAMIKVVFPQGIKYAIPGLSNELVVNIKDSSVLSVVGVFDLAFAAATVAGIYYKQLNAYLVAAVFYLIMTSVATWLLGKAAKRLDVKTHAVGSTSDQPVKVEA